MKRYLKFLAILSVAILANNAHAYHQYTIASTGQDTCWNSTGYQITCPVQGQPYYGSDGSIKTPAMSFTDNGDGTILDNNTGLYWQKVDSPNDMSHGNASAYCSASTTGGRTWRLPNVVEFFSFFDTSKYKVGMNGAYFIQNRPHNTTYDPGMWTSTKYSDATGTLLEGSTAYDSYYAGTPTYTGLSANVQITNATARCVSGDALSGEHVNNGDGTATFKYARKMVTTNMVYKNWKDGLEYCENLNYKGFSDWHMPNIKDGLLLINASRSTGISVQHTNMFFNKTNATADFYNRIHTSTDLYLKDPVYLRQNYYMNTESGVYSTDEKANRGFVTCFRNMPENYYTIDTSLTGGLGNITSDDGSINTAKGKFGKTYWSVATRVLSANVKSGFAFKGWTSKSNTCSGNTSSISFSVDKQIDCNAVMAPLASNTYPVALWGKENSPQGRAWSTDGNIDTDAGKWSSNYIWGSTVTLNQANYTGSKFKNWAGSQCPYHGSTASSITLDVKSGMNCTPVFDYVDPGHPLSITVITVGSGTVKSTYVKNIDTSQGMNSANRFYGYREYLNATADSGNSFVSWSGDCSGTSSAFLLNVVKNSVCTATFKADTPTNYSMTVSKAGTGTGQITSTDGNINTASGKNSYSSYISGNVASLTALPDAGSSFTSWSGDCSGTNPAYALTITKNSACVATFSSSPVVNYSMTVSKAGAGSGEIITSDGNINTALGKNSYGGYVNGNVASLTATPNTGSVFASWSGDCSGTINTFPLTITKTSACTANFNLSGITTKYTLSVSKAGTGTGNIASMDSNINTATGKNSYSNYVSGTSVTLFATASSDSSFSGWSGSCSGNTNTIVFSMGSDKSCSASFTKNTPGETPTTGKVVPTLNEWGMIIMGISLCVVGIVYRERFV